MNFVQKQVLKGQVNKLQAELGLGGSNSSQKYPLSSVFGDELSSTGAPRADNTFPVDDAVELHAALPANYPPLLHIVYIDTSILSLHAAAPVEIARNAFYAALVGVVVNIVVSAFGLAVRRPDAVTDLIISVIAGLAVTLLSMFVFETAFRGAYKSQRTSQVGLKHGCHIRRFEKIASLAFSRARY
jgi:hypothetical protein